MANFIVHIYGVNFAGTTVDGTAVPMGCRGMAPGLVGFAGQFLYSVYVPFGASYAATLQLVRDGAVAAALAQLAVVIGPDDTVQIFGGPQPTLADLGG
jgi:hypothetical protein